MADEVTPVNQRVALADIAPHERNYNRHPADQVKRIAASLRKFGQVRSIVVWRSTILAGHGVVEAARSLGWKEITADVLPDTYPEHLALAYVAADNELARLGDPDQAALAAILQESAAADAELLEAIGYGEAELERLLSEIEMTALGDASEGGGREALGKGADKQVKAVLYAQDVATFEAAILATGKRNRGDAVLEICRFYLGAHESKTKGQLDAELESILAAQSAA
jgi:ParB-like chromosome segregation protein Spo0J